MSIWKNGKLVAGGSQALPLLISIWSDHILDDVQWLRADTFSWQNGNVYKAAYRHLLAEADLWIAITSKSVGRGPYYFQEYIEGANAPYRWWGGETVYSTTQFPAVNDVLYSDSAATIITDEVQSTNCGLNNLQTETVAGTTISFYLAADGHKIVASNQESNVMAIYNATGVAWYYIIDPINQRFKLPRAKHNKYADTLGVAGTGKGLGLSENGTTQNRALQTWSTWLGMGPANTSNKNIGESVTGGGNFGADRVVGVTTDVDNSGLIAQQTQDTDQYKYLYFYVGNFTQTALENTAGVTTEALNSKADADFNNTNMIDYVVAKQDPTSSNGYTWYRKYKSGWVEQGGITPTAIDGTAARQTVTMPVEMSDANYTVYVTITRPNDPDFRDQFLVAGLRTETNFVIYSNWAGSGNGTKSNRGTWLVMGMAA